MDLNAIDDPAEAKRDEVHVQAMEDNDEGHYATKGIVDT